MQSFELSTNSADPQPKTSEPGLTVLVKASKNYPVQKLNDPLEISERPEQPKPEETKEKNYLKKPSEDPISEARAQRPSSPFTQVRPSKIDNTQASSIDVATVLNFSRRNINRLPKTIPAYTETLYSLDISHNQLTDISPEFFTLTKLKILKLSHNYIRALPDEMFSKLLLEQLLISHNYLISIPQSIEQSKNTLTALNLSYNRINEIPKELTRLSKLKSLWINNNCFTVIPATFDSLESLKDFALDWFKYTNPPYAAFQTSKDKKAIRKLFKLCQILREFNNSEVSFEEFVVNLSEKSEVSVFDVRDSHNRNLLHIAVLEEEVGIMQYVLQKKSHLTNELDQEKQTALSLAIREEKYLIAEMLMLYGSDPNCGGGALGSCLHMAVTKMQLNLVKELLKNGADPNAHDSEGNTPFHILSLIFSKDVSISAEIAEVLIDSGCDIISRNNDLWTPIHLMVKRGQIEGISWILNHNKTCADAKKAININAKGGSDDWTPLHLAANLGYIDIFNILAENDSEIPEKTKSGKSLRSVCHSTLLMTKFVRKAECDWVKNQLIKKVDRTPKLLESSPNVNIHRFNRLSNNSPVKNMKMIQERNLQQPDAYVEADTTSNRLQDSKTLNISKQMRRRFEADRHRTSAGGRDLYQPKPKEELSIFESKDHEIGPPQQGKEDLTAEENSVLDIDEKIKRDFKNQEALRILPTGLNNIQKIRITQSFRNRISDQSGSFIVSDLADGSDESRLQLSGLVTITNHSATSKNVLPQEFYGYIKKFESYDEIKKYQKLLLDGALPLSEKLKFIVYLKAIHFKTSQQIQSYSSEQLPLELFTISEYIDDELRKRRFSSESLKRLQLNYDIVPKILMAVLGFLSRDTNKFKGATVLRAEVCRALGDMQCAWAKKALELVMKSENADCYLKRVIGCALLKVEIPPVVLGKKLTYGDDDISENVKSEAMEDIEREKPIFRSLVANKVEHQTVKIAELHRPLNRSNKTKEIKGFGKNPSQPTVASLANNSNQANLSIVIGSYVKQKYIREETIKPEQLFVGQEQLFVGQDQPRNHRGDFGEEDNDSESLHQTPSDRVLVRGKFKKPKFPLKNPQEGSPRW